MEDEGRLAALAVAEVIREKGVTRVQSRCRLPPYQFPSNRSPPSTPATETAPRPKRKKAPAPARTAPPKKNNFEASRTSSLRRRGEEGDGATAPPAAARAQRFNHKYQLTSVNEVNIGRYRCSADRSVQH
ncbi:unnamed protein product [Pleuronectes platessa]|uniref:Uncharacterized protein n=1 Tax=Pleuronectes platessa TaxID=8262 RepID=A0A9N7VUL6_PLEPL|nr:unnamed protein product [Pleuronectes platessa]